MKQVNLPNFVHWIQALLAIILLPYIWIYMSCHGLWIWGRCMLLMQLPSLLHLVHWKMRKVVGTFRVGYLFSLMKKHVMDIDAALHIYLLRRLVFVVCFTKTARMDFLNLISVVGFLLCCWKWTMLLAFFVLLEMIVVGFLVLLEMK